jgi:hypothetical protein
MPWVDPVTRARRPASENRAGEDMSNEVSGPKVGAQGGGDLNRLGGPAPESRSARPEHRKDRGAGLGGTIKDRRRDDAAKWLVERVGLKIGDGMGTRCLATVGRGAGVMRGEIDVGKAPQR